jgi:hypothetical protein
MTRDPPSVGELAELRTLSVEDVTSTPLMLVDPAGVAERDILHDLRQGHLCYMDRQVEVVAHGGKAMSPMAKPCHPFLQQQVKMVAVIVTEKDRLAPITTQHDMIEATGNMQSWFACHDGSINSMVDPSPRP